MEFKELLGRLCMPIKQKVNEEELIKAEEANITDVLVNVRYICLRKKVF